jgi:superkiller protein 3
MYGFSDYEANSIEATFREGLDLLEADHCEEALEAFDWVINRSPEYAEAYFYRGVALLNLNRSQEAVHSLQRAVELAPTDTSYLSHLGYAYLVSGKPRSALEPLERSIALAPDNVQSRAFYALALKGVGNIDRAREELERALDLEPDNADLLFHYGAILRHLGREDDALSQWEKLLRKNPNHVDALGACGGVWMRRQDYAKAVTYLRQVTSLAPHHVGAWINLLSAYEMLDRSDAVIAMASDAIENGVEEPRIYVMRGKHYLAGGKTREAISDLEHAVLLADKNFEAHFLLAHALGAQGRVRQALKHASRAVDLRPHDRLALLIKAELHRALGDLAGETECLTILLADSPREFYLVQRKVQNLVQLGQFDEALITLDQYLHHQPANHAAWLLYAEVAEKSGNDGAAWRAYRRMIGIGKVPAAGYLAYAAFLVRHKRLELAADVLSAGAAVHPRDASLQACRAASLQNLGRAAESRTYLEDFIRVGEASSEILWLLGRAYYMLGNYVQALEAFREARQLDCAPHRNIAPNFQCLIAEAYTLHHLGRTTQGIQLLEQAGGRYGNREVEYLEALGELNEFAGNYGRALALYERALGMQPSYAPVLYRCARVSARLRSWRISLEYLTRAIAADESLATVARSEKLFRPLWLTPKFHRLVQTRLASPDVQKALLVAGGVSAFVIVCAALWRIFH